MPRTPSKFAGLAQLPKHAIDLVRLCAYVFDEQQLVLRRRLPPGPDQRNKNAETTAVERASCRAFPKRAQTFRASH